MSVAQSLYENGYITYMRTDSTFLSDDAVNMVRHHIETEFGTKYLPAKPNRYGNKAGAQEAHEAIRPTDFSIHSISDMDASEKRLYELIWKRAIASQMSEAQIEKTTAKIGISTTLTADYRMNDHWNFASSLDLNSSQMPLRGLRVGTSGDLISASSTYRWSDLTRVTAGVNYMKMDDGNERQSLSLTLDRRLITKPHYKLTTHLRMDTSRNSESNVNYFNPSRDMEVSAILDNVWLLWRRYDRSFGHRLQVGVGEYWQQNFGSNTSWLISYEQQFKWDNRFEIEYGVTRTQHAYDGTNEFFTQLFARLNLLF